MTDERDRTYAELIVDDCLRVEPGWQVLVGGNPQARPLLEELCAAIGRRGAYALLRVSFEGFLPQSLRWVEAVPMEVLAKPAPLFSHELRPPMRSSSSRPPTTRAPPRRSTPRGWAPCRLRIAPTPRA
jgi:hypothetical protein